MQPLSRTPHLFRLYKPNIDYSADLSFSDSPARRHQHDLVYTKLNETRRTAKALYSATMPPISDEEWADLVAHELPHKDDAVIGKYLESRHALIAEEKKHRSGTVIPLLWRTLLCPDA